MKIQNNPALKVVIIFYALVGITEAVVSSPLQQENRKTPESIASTDSTSKNPKLTQTEPAIPSFSYAAKVAMPTVVCIKTYASMEKKSRGRNPLEDLLKDFFGDGFKIEPRGPREPQTTPEYVLFGEGSGVICTEDGYIVTNNHVIDGADKIEVFLENNRQYKAKVIGQYPPADLALLKIAEKNLPFLKMGDSDALEVGEWVLTIGHPCGLRSTVTKGIVSAKNRGDVQFGNKTSMSIQSYIQTDAAMNTGNSGGALVNLKGELVGINTAISTTGRGGTFIGYGFSIPSSLVAKVVNDLIKDGFVHRVMLGINAVTLTSEIITKKALKRTQGVYIADITKGSVAAQAGLKEGDIIIAINGKEIKQLPELHEQLMRYEHNTTVKITYDRKGKVQTIPVTLQETQPATTQLKYKKDNTFEFKGAILEDVKPIFQNKFNIYGGVMIKEVGDGQFKNQGIKPGFIIISIGEGEKKEAVKSTRHLNALLQNKKGAILVGGINSTTGKKGYCAIDLDN